MGASRGLRRRSWIGVVLGGFGLLVTAGRSPVEAAANSGSVTSFSLRGNTATIAVLPAQVRVIFYTDDVFRIWLAPDGNFTDPANSPPLQPGEPGANIVVKRDYPGVEPGVADVGDYYRLTTSALALRVYKAPLRFALYTPDDRSRIWEEIVGPVWSGLETTQILSRGENEQFFGGGMQNGRFSHRGQNIKISVSYDWGDGGSPNSVPFYLSTAGYGVYRNTFAAGSYSFIDPVVTTHEESRFDAYYFVGGPKRVIDLYTELTGRPFMPPVYGLEMGDADCYLHHRDLGERHTLDALKVADEYVRLGIPLGWMLVNDGYRCGYEHLEKVAAGLNARDIQLGLWTSTGLAHQAEEARAGMRVRKLDVDWVAPGYRFALSACEDAFGGVELHSDARGFVWSPEGWSGSQRCAVHWSGDQHGNWDSIRWQIPTYAGATMSGQAHTSSDVDGIFGGSPKTYTRDLQWKSLLPVAMTMNGWSPRNKHPWRDGEPYLSINRGYVQLRERLLPYLYTYAARAHRDGVGLVRPLVLEYSGDPNTWGDQVKYEFLAGEAFLVAPVYEDGTVRDGIYLPAGTWIDYWTGQRHVGPVTLDRYPAPLERLPLFVKAGSIVPMWPEGTRSWRTRERGQLDLDVYPGSEGAFTLYEDDGVSRGYSLGEYAEQTFTATAGPGVSVTIGPSAGNYAGKPASRTYVLRVHHGDAPREVRAGDAVLTRHPTKADFDAASSGWYHDPERSGVTSVKIAPLPLDATLAVRVH